MQLTSSPPRADWLCAVNGAFQALTADLTSNSLSSGETVDCFRLAVEPINDTERLIFRGYVSNLIVRLLYFGERTGHSASVARILSVWPSIQCDPNPVSVMRCALERHSRFVVSPSDLRLAHQVRDLLEQHYPDKIVTHRLAAQLNVSSSRMNRCFRSIFGMSIHEHLRRVRVERGLGLVAQGVKVEAAGLAVGFRSKKDFYRAVRQLMGCTPAEFRDCSSRDVVSAGAMNRAPATCCEYVPRVDLMRSEREHEWDDRNSNALA